jgi:peptidoglycan/xylan/chitin deacetylase (PgdA/CDA1 family)
MSGVAPIPILLYHSVSDRPSQTIAPFSVTPADFERHLDLIVRGGRCVLTVSALMDRLTCHEHIDQIHLAAITFDDGFADTLEVAAPMLAARCLPATAYFITGCLFGRHRQPDVAIPGRMMSWTQVRELEMAGFEVGAHTHTHPHLDIIPRATARDEVRRSKELLEAELGHTVRSFAYPHGYANSFLRGEARGAGFDSACGVRNRLSHAEDDRWCLARLTVRADTRIERVAAWLRGEGAPRSRPGESIQTGAWREVRRLRRLLAPRIGQD